MRIFQPPALALCLAMATSVCTVAQDTSQKSIADIAKEAQQKKAAHAKIVISNDNLTIEKKPLPALNFEGVDNSDEVYAAMDAYCKEHTPKECEELIHSWYDKYSDLLAQAVEENKTLQSRQQDRSETSTYNPNRDYQQNRKMQEAAARSSRSDYNKYKQNGLLEARIQQAFMKIRSNLQGTGRRYPWFKILNGNGNGSF